jgi:hypothetical protein
MGQQTNRDEKLRERQRLRLTFTMSMAIGSLFSAPRTSSCSHYLKALLRKKRCLGCANDIADTTAMMLNVV